MIEPPPTVIGLLVPLDGTPEAQRAIDPALRIARPLGCPIELVTVYDPVRGGLGRDLDEVADSIDYESVDVVVVGRGRPGDVITELAAEQPGTLICMATQDRDDVNRLLLGSVSSHVIAHNPSPVLLIGPAYQPRPEPTPYHQLVVCLDITTPVDTLLDTATTWAQLLDLHIELVHITDPTTNEPTTHDDVEHHLTQATTRLAAHGLTATTTIANHAQPAAALAALLAERPDSIALTATHGRTGLPRLILGSITGELLAASPVPVLVARLP